MGDAASLLVGQDLGPDGRVVYGREGPEGREAAERCAVRLPWLAGEREEQLFAGSGLELRAWRGRAAGRDLEERTREIYAALLAAVGTKSLVRVWNYVPEINRVEDGLERYQAFSRGRARAFEAAWGAGFEGRLPAASAVGGAAGELVVIAAWGEGRAEPRENPGQVPAYRYPSEYGPRSPSFARAIQFWQSREEWVFISGTAAVRGHASVAAEDLATQVQCTWDNLGVIGGESGVGSDLGATGGWRRAFKVYLKRAADLAAAQALLAGRWNEAEDRVVWVEADICRRELLVEIEVTLRRARAG